LIFCQTKNLRALKSTSHIAKSPHACAIVDAVMQFGTPTT